MKRIGFWVIALALGAAAVGRPQDAATEERLNQLDGKIRDLIDGQKALGKRLEELAAELGNLREQQSKPLPVYASQEDFKRLAKAIEEVDRKRIEGDQNNQKIRAELLSLIDTLKTSPLPVPRNPGGAPPPSNTKSGPAPAPNRPPADKEGASERGFYYTVAKGDTLSAIVAACREKNIKVTQEQILKANPRLKKDPNLLREGMKLFIPLPQALSPSP
ncbi:MAG: LysM peptidoglycan-binding domain-containing protein [Verrucomicrobiota bacterium]|jgi:LysM repeat protein